LYTKKKKKLDVKLLAVPETEQLSESGTLPEYKVLLVTGFLPCLYTKKEKK